MGGVRLLTVEEMSEEAADLFATVRYVGPEPEVDQHGMPVVGPEPWDPDDE
jgi:hypothetical protein